MELMTEMRGAIVFHLRRAGTRRETVLSWSVTPAISAVFLAISDIVHRSMRGCLFHHEHHAKGHGLADHGLNHTFEPQHAPCECF